MSFDFDIKNLQTLLKDKNEDEESDDDQVHLQLFSFFFSYYSSDI